MDVVYCSSLFAVNNMSMWLLISPFLVCVSTTLEKDQLFNKYYDRQT